MKHNVIPTLLLLLVFNLVTKYNKLRQINILIFCIVKYDVDFVKIITRYAINYVSNTMYVERNKKISIKRLQYYFFIIITFSKL